ncbi:MAG: hypothetical protein GQ574_09855 [Crocinitomix sp.]|nr:hypothetical protein [Crocinitomix sp.]
MPIDQMMLGPMLDTFKTMADDCTAKGYSGESYDQMMTALKRMEQLGQEMDDFMEFSTKMTTENLQMDFSLAYGRVLSEGASQQSSSADTYDDGALLKQTVDALKNAVSELKKGEETAILEARKHHSSDAHKNLAETEVSTLAKSGQIIAPIEALIAYGESGVNLPTFLRVQIEKGLDKAMEGSAVLREGVAYDLDFAVAASINPYNIAIREEQGATFDELAKKAKFDVPNSLSVTLAFDKISQDYVSRVEKWTAIERAWERIFSLLDTWSMAQTRFAPGIEPWVLAGSPSSIQAAIAKDKATLPGIIQERVRLLMENYALSFDNVFTHETFIWSVKNHHFSYSQIYTELLVNTIHPQCKPTQLLDASIIQTIEHQYENKEMPNPENYRVLDRQEAVYDQYFGAGNFVVKVGPKPDFGFRNAAAWNL